MFIESKENLSCNISNYSGSNKENYDVAFNYKIQENTKGPFLNNSNLELNEIPVFSDAKKIYEDNIIFEQEPLKYNLDQNPNGIFYQTNDLNYIENKEIEKNEQLLFSPEIGKYIKDELAAKNEKLENFNLNNKIFSNDENVKKNTKQKGLIDYENLGHKDFKNFNIRKHFLNYNNNSLKNNNNFYRHNFLKENSELNETQNDFLNKKRKVREESIFPLMRRISSHNEFSECSIENIDINNDSEISSPGEKYSNYNTEHNFNEIFFNNINKINMSNCYDSDQEFNLLKNNFNNKSNLRKDLNKNNNHHENINGQNVFNDKIGNLNSLEINYNFDNNNNINNNCNNQNHSKENEINNLIDNNNKNKNDNISMKILYDFNLDNANENKENNINYNNYNITINSNSIINNTKEEFIEKQSNKSKDSDKMSIVLENINNNNNLNIFSFNDDNNNNIIKSKIDKDKERENEYNFIQEIKQSKKSEIRNPHIFYLGSSKLFKLKKHNLIKDLDDEYFQSNAGSFCMTDGSNLTVVNEDEKFSFENFQNENQFIEFVYNAENNNNNYNNNNINKADFVHFGYNNLDKTNIYNQKADIEDVVMQSNKSLNCNKNQEPIIISQKTMEIDDEISNAIKKESTKVKILLDNNFDFNFKNLNLNSNSSWVKNKRKEKQNSFNLENLSKNKNKQNEFAKGNDVKDNTLILGTNSFKLKERNNSKLKPKYFSPNLEECLSTNIPNYYKNLIDDKFSIDDKKNNHIGNNFNTKSKVFKK